ncbi:YihY/virulence factor BrkB family protein [Adhaeribacter sp. BT258]|uniref:YihY/virulence factor BrkB family protein n=1 Tax=Adhaeribacter terrigena TaxID=2793070 RepID=A0ABS1C1K8_9BACT|nr:YihY/virulence factor BrkB family protein [Adhaeribacter terrigena]MBK0403288.1 YihY/virulence factor BrkB family protein [Adhaeribacter terrigena]
MSTITPNAVWYLAKNSASEFMKNNSLRLAAALAYNTIFSLPPLLFIILMAAGAFFGEAAMSGELYNQSRTALGEDAARQIQTMITNLNKQETHGIAKWIGFATLFFAATTFFVTLQESLNAIWNIKPKPKNGIAQMAKARFLSFGMILSIALLMLVSFVISAALSIFTDYLKQIFPDIAVYLLKLVDFVVSVGVITLLFALIYKFLPDAIIRWKDVWAGGAITALLFVIGKFLIGWYLSVSDVGSAYGVAGSIIIILVWIYYSSLIVFYGAEFTQEYAKRFGEEIRPKSYAVSYTIQEIPNNIADKKAGRPKSEGSFRKQD